MHLVETLEFLYVVRQIGWSGPLKLDLFPYREDRIEAVRQSVASIRRLEECVDRLPIEELEEIQSRHDAMAAQALVRKALIG